MLNKIKGQIFEIITTIEEALENLTRARGAAAEELRELIAQATLSIESAAAEAPNLAVLGEELRGLLDKLSASPARKRAREAMREYRQAVRDIPSQFKVLFLPYYENTWDSLQSVYEAFADDERFVCEIVIIPIERNRADGGASFQYEDYLTPRGIPVTHYDAYDPAEDRPDIIFYNNPYDGVNVEKFQSANLAPHARCMIYVPYYMIRNQSYNPEYYPRFRETLPNVVALPGHNNASYIIAQCEVMKKLAEKYSRNAKKMRVLGNPKCDMLYRAKEGGDWPRHAEWERVIQGKKVFMLNTHYQMFEKAESPLDVLDALFATIHEQEDTALIWRPHPQTFIVFEGMADERVQKFYALLDRVESEERMILDRSGAAASALMYCDALISSGSSIIAEALFLDKPVFVLNPDPAELRGDAQAYADPAYEKVLRYTHTVDKENIWMSQVAERIGLQEPLPEGKTEAELEILYREKAHKEPFQRFLREILAGEDGKKELRAEYRKQMYANLDGTCGQEILRFVKTLL